MDTDRNVIARVGVVDLRWVDWVLAVLLTIGELANAASQPHPHLGVLAVVSLIVLTSSVAWRRRDPVLATLVAITGLIAFYRSSGNYGYGLAEMTVIPLSFYMLGRRSRGRENAVAFALVFGYWLAANAAITYAQAGASVGEVLGSGALFGGLPFAVGRTLATRNSLTRELEATAARLQEEQEVSAHHAAGEERNRMARELHDVIAHSVSVMVIQCSGARSVARGDFGAALTALQVVESSGREALVELRRIVGVLRRGSDELAGSAAPGLSQLEALVDRARSSGLPVELRVGGRRALSPGLDLVAYRILQEALTNVIKHAGPVPTVVSVRFTARELELEVSDTGRGPAREREDRDGPGHGLLGMGERVALYGGELSTGPRAGGGFEVRARIPFDGKASSPQELESAAARPNVMVAAAEPVRWPWLDPLLAGVALVVLEIAVLTGSHHRGPLALNLIVVAGMTLVAIWRRRSPLLFLVIVGALASVLNDALTSLDNLALVAAYVLLVPAYAVGAWEKRPKAVLGLAIFFSGSAINVLVVRHQTVGDFAGGAFLVCAAWAAGRAIRSGRVLTAELKLTSARLTVEREDRARLAVAGERSRIARELHAVVARSVAAMVIQAEAARGRLDRDPLRADAAMGAIENTGRQTLAEMRRILGVLRHADDVGEREPQPGVAQIYTLIQRARERGQPVELSVDGELGTLPAGVDLGIYRILEDALNSVRQQSGGTVGVALRFGEEDLELRLTARCGGPSDWPTEVMRERVAL
ncbi:MAG TPA: histidine kinase, partial [Solirubrobacteraceae bacterium]|nr:histidine kinase [Solirubrobacteraceae bacterium]